MAFVDEANGTTGEHFPYADAKRKGNIRVTGLPDGVQFKKPNLVGLKEGVSILSVKDQIKMTGEDFLILC